MKADDSWVARRAVASAMVKQLDKLTPVERVDLLEKLIDTLDPIMVKALAIAYTACEKGNHEAVN